MGTGQRNRERLRSYRSINGEPREVTDTLLVWHKRGPWKIMVGSKAFYKHNFPADHTDSIESSIDYRVPVDNFDDIARFDGSAIEERTVGEMSARCHDEEANCLALKLMHDIVIDAKTVEEARVYYRTEFLDYRRKKAAPTKTVCSIPSGRRSLRS